MSLKSFESLIYETVGKRVDNSSVFPLSVRARATRKMTRGE
jgi:hypothetical protein